MLPNFIVIGAGKSGTTSLYHWLRAHPDVYMPARLKETFYFCFDPTNPTHRAQAGTARFPVTRREDYEALFDGSAGAMAVGEATPAYLDSPVAPAQLRALIPDAKLVVSIRDQVQRVVSHAQMNIRLGLADDLAADTRRLALTDEHEYASKFRRWFDAFPREQFLIFRFDDLAADPSAVVSRILSFIGVDGSYVPPVGTVYNPGGVPRSKTVQRVVELPALRALRPYLPSSAFRLGARMRSWNARSPEPLPADLITELAVRYRADAEATADLTGLDLSHWTALRRHEAEPLA